ncbi:peptidase inhibitor family I36 protein [Streptomyces sp. NPDC059629]|uniref:peptidase inhibitor family I36 protein n=1 Tax=Streptomyces sp. NPDC059629 TaxID=3346889 RepID=UPI0036B3D718
MDMHLRRTLQTALLGGVLVAAGIATEAPAQAAAVCPSNAVCFYQNSNLGGSMFKMPGSAVQRFSAYRYYNGANANDSASSVRNNTSRALTVFTNDNYKGVAFSIPAHSTIYDLGYWSLNDCFSSAKLG